MNGRIKMDLSVLKSYAKDRTMLYFWVNVLLMAGPDGTIVTSVRHLARDLGMSVQQVRTCLNKLVSNTQVTQSATQFATHITICDYDSYNDDQHTSNTVNNTRATQSEKNAPSFPPDGSSSDSSSLSPLLFPQEKEKEGDTDVSPKKRDKPVSGPTDYSFVVKLWNDSARRNVPKIRGLTPARKEKVRLRIKEMGGEEDAKTILAECFRKISESDFCNGATGKWSANFDWFFDNEKNWMKVLEGNYDNRKEKTQLEILAENVAKADAYYEQRYHGYGGASPYGDQARGREDGPDEQ